MHHAEPSDVKSFPFVLIGNKVDLADQRRVDSSKAEAWCQQNHDMKYFETSAKDNVQVKEAFIEMIRKAIKRDPKDQIILPDNIAGPGGMGGGIKLSAKKG